MKYLKIIAFSIILFSMLSCQKKIKTMNNVGGTVFSSLSDFKKSTASNNTCYVESLGGGFFVRQNSTSVADNYLVLKRNDGAVFVKEEFATQGIIRPEWYGAKGDGKTDDLAAFNKAISKVALTQGTLVTGAKKYHLSQAIKFPGVARIKGCTWIGNGATLDNEVMITGQDVTIKDIDVENSPANGFSWNRGQGGFFYNLKATNCAKAGFLFGGKNGAQVAWASFYSFTAIGNENGFVLDGSFSKSWVNANLCDAFYSRANKKYGVLIKGKANYNTFNALHCEGNGKSDAQLPALLVEKARDNTFVGGHLATTNRIQSSVVIDRGANNVYVGGRYVTGNAQVKKAIDAPKSKIEMSRQVVRKKKKGELNEENW